MLLVFFTPLKRTQNLRQKRELVGIDRFVTFQCEFPRENL